MSITNIILLLELILDTLDFKDFGPVISIFFLD